MEIKPQIEKVAESKIPTKWGELNMIAFQNVQTKKISLALVKGIPIDKGKVPVRVHSSCITSEVFGSQKCDCKEQLDQSIKYISAQDAGIVIYLDQEGRGIGLINKLKAYNLQNTLGLNTIDANKALGLPVEMRTYEAVPEIISLLGVRSISLITNNPHKIKSLKKLGVEIEKVIASTCNPNKHNADYLQTKKQFMGHLL